MLKKLCDNCKSEMDIDNEGFRIEINGSISENEVIEYSADLCEKCEKDLIEAIETTLKSYGVKEEKEEKEEIELNEDSY